MMMIYLFHHYGLDLCSKSLLKSEEITKESMATANNNGKSKQTKEETGKE